MVRSQRTTSRGTRNSGGPTRKFVWARQNGSVAVPTADATDQDGITIDLMSNFQQAYGADILGSTIMRVRGTIFWNVNAVVVSGISCVAGLRVAEQVDLQADAQGPLTAMHSDWMAFDTTILNDEQPGNSVVDRREIDVRSSRKMEELGQTLALSLEHDNAGDGLQVKYLLSVGLKLP